MIYVDTSVVLALLLVEDRQPHASLWQQALVSSRLLTYEVWNRIHAKGLGDSHGDRTRELLGRFSYLELSPGVLGLALEPLAIAVRTLDVLHLSSVQFLRSRGTPVSLATFDDRMALAAKKLKIPLFRAGQVSA